MSPILLKLIPIIFIFCAGYILKSLKMLKKETGDFFLKVVFYVTLPALILSSLSRIHLDGNLFFLPLSAILIVLGVSGLAHLIAHSLKLEKKAFGAFIVGASIMNIGFTLPFFIMSFGQEGIARVSLFDFGNGLMVYTFVYFLATRFGKNRTQKVLWKKFLYSIPLIALILALVLNVGDAPIPNSLNNFLRQVGSFTTPLIMLALGTYFTPHFKNSTAVFSVVFTRMLGGLAIGFILVYLFNLEGLNRLIVLIGSAAPIGYNTLTFSSLEDLDSDFAASAVSFAALLGIIFIPFLIILLS